MPPLSARPARDPRLLVVTATGIVAALMLAFAHTAAAGDDLGIRRLEFWPWSDAPARSAPRVEMPALRHHGARRIWAASPARPLRITLARHRSRLRVAARSRDDRRAWRETHPRSRVVSLPRIIVPKPPRPALVSIYADRTLRTGDAVMMADGIHVFRGTGDWPLRPRDFVRLPLAASLGWHLRQSLNDLDRNPPTRWTSIEATSG